MKQSGSTLRFIVAVFLLLAAAVAIGLQRDRVYAENLAAPDDLLYVRSGKAMSHAALSYNAILSDVYWIRAIQHFEYVEGTCADPHRTAVLTNLSLFEIDEQCADLNHGRLQEMLIANSIERRCAPG